MNLDLEDLKEVARKSTRVTCWYAHPPSGEDRQGEATVRGPFNRWFYVSGGKGYEKYVADVNDDAVYAAVAMNTLPFLIARIEQLEKQLQAFKMTEDL